MAETVSFKRRGGGADHVSLTVAGGESKDFKLNDGVLRTSNVEVIAQLRVDPAWTEQSAPKASKSEAAEADTENGEE